MRGRALLGAAITGATCAACNLLVSTNGLSGDESDAGNAADGTTPSSTDAASDDPAANDGSSGGESGTEAGGDAGTYRDEVLADNPVFYMRLEETTGTSLKDEMSSTPATITGSVELGVAGVFDGSKAVKMDGTSAQGILIGQRFHFEARAPFTMEGWLLPDTYDTAYRALVSHWFKDGSGVRQSYSLWVQSNDGIGFERYVDDQPFVAQMKPLPPTGVYHHVVGVYDGDALNLFVDGALIDTTADTRNEPPTPTGTWLAGKIDPTGAVAKGSIDEVAIYDKALTAQRVKAHYDAAKK